jgi:peptide/nickel transport system substrate-binding protein
MQLRRKLGLAMTIGAVAATMSLGLVAPTVSGANAPTGTITFAEGPGANPNFIFPYVSCQYFSVATLNQFQTLMFRPLYWFGVGKSAAVSYPLSTGNKPKMSNGDKTATITMKGWKFADGQTVNGESVMFFLNMLDADPGGYCGNNGSFSIPTLIKNAHAKGNTVVINFTRSINPGFLIYNNLSFITPMPNSWDRTSATQKANCAGGKYGASSTKVACKNVETYLDAQSANTSTYTGSMWQSGVDGPWRLTSFDNLGNVTFKPNFKYSGPVKAKVAVVKEVAYTSTQAEENDLQAGKLSLGFVDPGVLTSPAPGPLKAGANWGNLASRYNMIVGPAWDFNYMPFNFSANDPKAAAISQLYIRQALQTALDQNGIITNINKGYGLPDYSPLPPTTPTSIAKPFPNPYPFSLTAAKALLTSHGWTMQGGVMTCTDPGTGASQCGAGIDQGYTLNFKLIYNSGFPVEDKTVAAMVADWGQIGINVTFSTESFNNVIGDCSSGSGYQICWWGGGWIYAPDFYPSGETFFTPQGGFNVGQYSDTQMTNLITQTDFGTADLTAYGKYAAEQLPVLYVPQAFDPGEVIKTLKSSVGFTTPLQNFMPEYMHY